MLIRLEGFDQVEDATQLLELKNLVYLISSLSPIERKQFQAELQRVIDAWVEKGKDAR